MLFQDDHREFIKKKFIIFLRGGGGRWGCQSCRHQSDTQADITFHVPGHGPVINYNANLIIKL